MWKGDWGGGGGGGGGGKQKSLEENNGNDRGKRKIFNCRALFGLRLKLEYIDFC